MKGMAMAWSDDEEEGSLPSTVSNYHFVDEKDEPISFHVLPIQWSEGERQVGKKENIFVHGDPDNGLQRIYKHVIAWKFDFSNENPELFVLSKENNWLKLQKPKKSFEDTIRSILITVQCLHYVKRNPQTSYKSLQVHLSKVFRCFQNDLVDHFPLIRDSVKWDDALARSKLLLNFIGEKATKTKLSYEDFQAQKKRRCVVDGVDDLIDDSEKESYDVDYLFASVCAFCDDGGNLLCCEGRCLRSFHPTAEAAVGSDCKSLGFTKDEVDEMPTFFCKNCKYKQHQCFFCGKLGSSNNSKGAEVFPCVSAICGKFYHASCVANLLYRDNGVSAEELEKKIAMGEPFTCPIHKCCICKQGEKKKDFNLQFAVCMRCPKSYHRKCLPRKICFEERGGIHGEERLIPRAWEGLLPKRILIYCTKHEINEEGRTIIRDHLKFPDIKVKKTIVEESKRKLTSESPLVREKFEAKKRELPFEAHPYRVGNAPAISKEKQKLSAVKDRNGDKVFSGFDKLIKVTMNTSSRKGLKTSICGENKPSLGGHEKHYSNGDRECQKSPGHEKDRGNETSGKQQFASKEKHRRGILEISSMNKLSGNEICKEIPPLIKRAENTNQHSEPTKPYMQFRTANDRAKVNISDDSGRKCIGSSDIPGSGNRTGGLEEQFIGCMRDNSCRPYSNEVFSRFDTLRKLTINTPSRKKLETSLGKMSSPNGERSERQKSLDHGKTWGTESSGKQPFGSKEKHIRGMVGISSVHKKLHLHTEHAENSKPSNPSMQFGTANGRTKVNDDAARRYIMSRDEPGYENRARTMEKQFMGCVTDNSCRSYSNEVFSGFDTLRKATINAASKNKFKTSIREEKKTSLGGHKKRSYDSDRERQKRLGHGKNWGNETSEKLQCVGKEKNIRGTVGISSMNKQDGGKLSAIEPYKKRPLNTKPCEPSKPGMQLRTANGGIQVNIPGDTRGSCLMSTNEIGSEIRVRNLEKQNTGCTKDNLSKPHCNENAEISKGESDIGAHVSVSSSGMNTSAVAPYAARLDKLNCSMQNALGSDSRDEHQTGSLRNPLGFAPGPHLDYSLDNSAGWIDG